MHKTPLSAWRTAILQDAPTLRQLQVPRTLRPPHPTPSPPPTLFRHAAAAGSVPAATALALHCDALGDTTAAVRLYKAAAARGHPVAQAVLGCGYYWGRRGLPRDPEDAMLWLGRAAKQLTSLVAAHQGNDSTASGQVGGNRQRSDQGAEGDNNVMSNANSNGRPVPWSAAYTRDVLPVVALLRRVEHVVPWTASTVLPGCALQRWRALELANWLAVVALLLGLLHLDGEGSRVDVPEAMRWLKHAAMLGSAEAERVLGSLYNTGQFG